MSKKDNKIKNTIALKRNVYAIILSLIFIVAVILVNILATTLAANYPLDIDLTADKQHTMSDSNIDFIKGINKKVNIYVCLTEDEYACKSDSSYDMRYYAAQQYFIDYNTANSNYYVQTVEMLQKYEMYNKNIDVTFLDIIQPSAAEITDNFKDYEWSAGDILVEGIFTIDGKEYVRRTAVPFSSVYTVEAGDASTEQYFSYYSYGMMENYALMGMGLGFMITENKIEQAVSAAIYKVISENTPLYLLPTSYCDDALIKDGLEETLLSNNFSVEYADGLLETLLAEENASKYDGIIIGNCKADISSTDRAIIDSFLHNNGNKGKALIYFAGTNTYKLTNLCGLLADWGIGVKTGVLYETHTSNAISENPTDMYLLSQETEYTTVSDASKKYYVGSNMVPLSQIYADSSTATYTRNTTILMRTASLGQTTIMPIDQNAQTWKAPDDAERTTFPAIIMSEDSAITDNKEYVSSYIVTFATDKFISKDWLSYDIVGNANFSLDIFNTVSGVSDNPFNFVSKTIKNENYTINVTSAKVNAIKIIFMAVVPLSLVSIGTFVWIRRKRK